MSPRRNWDSPNPSLASECVPPPRIGGEHSPAGEGLGESQFRRLEKNLSTLPTLRVPYSTWRLVKAGHGVEGPFLNVRICIHNDSHLLCRQTVSKGGGGGGNRKKTYLNLKGWFLGYI